MLKFILTKNLTNPKTYNRSQFLYKSFKMDIIYLKNSGFYIKSNKEFVLIDKPFGYYLNYYPKIDKDFTLENLMFILMKHQIDVDNLFVAQTAGFSLKPYFEKMQLSNLKKEKSNISKIIFSWVGQIDNIKEFGKPKYEISEYVNVSGKVQNDKQLYSLSFVHLNEIKNANFKLVTKIKFSHLDFGERWDENRKTIKKNFFKGVKSFTLHHIIGAFLNEISFYGYPENTDAVANEILQRNKSDKSYPIETLWLKLARQKLKSLNKKKLTKKNILRLEKTNKEIAYYEKLKQEKTNDK